MRGRRSRKPMTFGDTRGSSSLVKISVSHITESNHTDPRAYEQLVTSLKSEPDLNDLLSIKDKLPFKNPRWVAKCKTKAKGEKIGKSFRQILGREPDSQVEGSYQSIEAGKSIRPTRKYCDFTGFRAKYTDKKTGIRYYSHVFYRDICKLPNTIRDQYLELRNAVVNIK